METKFVITLCFALSVCIEVSADSEQEVKRGAYPFMALLYYPDESVVDATGARFLRGAVLIQADWLVTSAVGPSTTENSSNGFPRKTLLARAGAVTIDANFTLNEDEDEQEREIIQIVRPYNHSGTQWWSTDIALMKTLQPFNMTSAVSVTMLVNKMEYLEKTCAILVYAKKEGNWTEDRNLMQLSVELLPPSLANCGPHFVEKTMTCAADSDDNKSIVYDANYCQGNRGGPLICEGDVIGIQTYIDNDCKQPHLYQMLATWDNFISCGTEDKCQEEQCSKICDVSHKDSYDASITETTIKEVDTIKLPVTLTANNDASIEPQSKGERQTLATTLSSENDSTPYITNVFQSSAEVLATEQLTTERSTTEQSTLEQLLYEYSTSVTGEDTNTTKSWPREKYSNSRKSLEQQENLDTAIRQPKVEAQLQKTKSKHRSHNGGNINLLNHSIIFGYFIFARLI